MPGNARPSQGERVRRHRRGRLATVTVLAVRLLPGTVFRSWRLVGVTRILVTVLATVLVGFLERVAGAHERVRLLVWLGRHRILAIQVFGSREGRPAAPQ